MCCIGSPCSSQAGAQAQFRFRLRAAVPGGRLGLAGRPAAEGANGEPDQKAECMFLECPVCVCLCVHMQYACVIVCVCKCVAMYFCLSCV